MNIEKKYECPNCKVHLFVENPEEGNTCAECNTDFLTSESKVPVAKVVWTAHLAPGKWTLEGHAIVDSKGDTILQLKDPDRENNAVLKAIVDKYNEAINERN